MSILQFWRIIWARRWLILGASCACLVGTFVITLVLPPRWAGDARVVLNLLRPDPVTGDVVTGSGPRTYAASQVALVTDYSVAGTAVEDLGWPTNPTMIALYNDRPSDDTRDFRHWAAQQIIQNTTASIIEGSNILDISYTGSSSEGARAVAAALRKAYIDTNLVLRRTEALRNADWFDSQAVKAKEALNEAEIKEAEFERANNVYMASSTTDLDTARLAALAASGDAGNSSGGGSNANVQLAEVNAEIAEKSQTLGTNHPDIVALRAKKAALERLIASAGMPTTHAGESALDAQAKAVLAKSDKIARLRQLQADVDARLDLYNKTVARAASLRQQAEVSDPDLTPLGAPTVPASPSFPNMLLLVPGSIAFGLVLGILISLLVELLHRRVRGPEDLETGLGVPLLAVISGVR